MVPRIAVAAPSTIRFMIRTPYRILVADLTREQGAQFPTARGAAATIPRTPLFCPEKRRVCRPRQRLVWSGDDDAVPFRPRRIAGRMRIAAPGSARFHRRRTRRRKLDPEQRFRLA